MKYEDLTLMQRIGLKRFIQSEPALHRIKLVWVMWNFKKAVEYFLNNDISQLNA